MKRNAIVICALVAGLGLGRTQAQTMTRAKFTPPVVPETYTDPVRFEATFSSTPASGGINYQRQRTTNFAAWGNEGAAIAPGDASTTITVPAPGGPQNFWRFQVIY